jgi:hypothetical protein
LLGRAQVYGENGDTMVSQPAGLSSVLRDKTARIDERNDAAMDLGNYAAF